MAKKKTNKEDAGPTYGARGKEDQLRGIKERSTEPGRMASSSLEPALGQSTQRRKLDVVRKSKENRDGICPLPFFKFCVVGKMLKNLYFVR